MGCIGVMLDRGKYEEDIVQRLAGHEIRWLKSESQEDRPEVIRGCDVILTGFLSEGELNEEEWEALRSVPAVQTISAGVDQVPMRRLGPNTELYANVGGWAEPIAEHVLAMALCCSRKLIWQTRDLKDGVFGRMGYRLRTLRGKVALMVGYGGIGQACARVLAGIGMEIHGLGRRCPKDNLLSRGWSMNELARALEKADLVVLALPLSNETRGLFDAALLAHMKEDAILINVARGAMINAQDLYDRMKVCPQFMVGLDVWWKEPQDGGPFSVEVPLFDLPNLVGSSHNSNQTEYALANALTSALINCVRLLSSAPGVVGKVRKEEYSS